MYSIKQLPEFDEWLSGLKDSMTRRRLATRLRKVSLGNLGDVQPVGEGVWEARIDWGPGYRIYYAQAGQRLILLLVGGDKRKQQADIEKAHQYWLDWQHRRKLK